MVYNYILKLVWMMMGWKGDYWKLLILFVWEFAIKLPAISLYSFTVFSIDINQTRTPIFKKWNHKTKKNKNLGLCINQGLRLPTLVQWLILNAFRGPKCKFKTFRNKLISMLMKRLSDWSTTSRDLKMIFRFTGKVASVTFSSHHFFHVYHKGRYSKCH